MSCYFTLFYCLLALRNGECNVVSLYVLCCPVNGSVCFVCCVFDIVCELFGKTIRNMFGCVCYFVVECDGFVECGWRCSIGYTMYGLPYNVCVVPVVPVSVCDVLHAVLYVCASCFVVRECAVSRYIDVRNCDMFSVVNVYLDHLKLCVVCV